MSPLWWARTGSDCRARRSIATGEVLEQGTVETARGAVIDVLDDGVLAQPGIAQAGGDAPEIYPVSELENNTATSSSGSGPSSSGSKGDDQ
jgi:hypothetical protein